MTLKPVNLTASIATRLRNVAAAKGIDLAFVLRRYAIERLLYRLSVSPERDRFVLKGAMLFTAWLPDPFRPTQDLDLLGFGDGAVPAIAADIEAICRVDVPDDGLMFDVKSLRAEPIRGNQEYGGVRVKLTALLARTQIPVQIDIGFGDAVTPAIVELEFPALLDTPAPRVRAYPRETVLAEKLQAIVMLGAVNTRIKDYYDLLALARLFDFNGATVRDALIATFERRGTPLPVDVPVGLSPEFAGDPQKARLWDAFIHRASLRLEPGDLAAAIEDIAAFVLPPLTAAHKGVAFKKRWKAGGPWRGVRKPRSAIPSMIRIISGMTPGSTFSVSTSAAQT
ncbi:MAG: nucleotidyl transferase AbiEii/AbiGii toxin family protein [Blastochloris sp.]|nr:nucleotidyl transferase AbiEii/AbiGii toxin family protein [Blastochloris sp.]